MATGDDHILVEQSRSSRVFILNRPKQLNALTFQMITLLTNLFEDAEKEDSVKLILVKGKGRAFCAGGDVASVIRVINELNWRFGAEFFRREFALNYTISSYSKPQVSILDGIVMGGGAGISIHGRFRVSTENTVFAMPETALGLFPDVGASYFLSNLPGFLGEYLALTGARLDGAELLQSGLATHFVPSQRLILLEEALGCMNSSDPDVVSGVINRFSEQPCLKETSACRRLDIINKCFSGRTVEEILSSLGSVKEKDKWVFEAIGSLRKASPTSLRISLRSIRQGRVQGVGQCLIREYRMVCHVLEGKVSKDFFEGCRAILLDKDRNPKWNPSELGLVDDSMVNVFFSRVDDEGWEDLKLPQRYNFPAYAIAKL